MRGIDKKGATHAVLVHVHSVPCQQRTHIAASYLHPSTSYRLKLVKGGSPDFCQHLYMCRGQKFGKLPICGGMVPQSMKLIGIHI